MLLPVFRRRVNKQKSLYFSYDLILVKVTSDRSHRQSKIGLFEELSKS